MSASRFLDQKRHRDAAGADRLKLRFLPSLSGGRTEMTSINFQTDPAAMRRYRVVSLVTMVEIPAIVWANDETGSYAVLGRGPKGTLSIVERWGPIKIVSSAGEPGNRYSRR